MVHFLPVFSSTNRTIERQGPPWRGGTRGQEASTQYRANIGGGKRKRPTRHNPTHRAQNAEARRKGKSPAGLGAEASAAGEAQREGGTSAAGETRQDAGTRAASRERQVVGRRDAREHQPPVGTGAVGEARQGVGTRATVGGTLGDPMDLARHSEEEPEDPEERARRVRAGREIRVSYPRSTTHYLGTLADTREISMVFRS